MLEVNLTSKASYSNDILLILASRLYNVNIQFSSVKRKPTPALLLMNIEYKNLKDISMFQNSNFHSKYHIQYKSVTLIHSTSLTQI